MLSQARVLMQSALTDATVISCASQKRQTTVTIEYGAKHSSFHSWAEVNNPNQSSR